jgi:hypothetical protein
MFFAAHDDNILGAFPAQCAENRALRGWLKPLRLIGGGSKSLAQKHLRLARDECVLLEWS